MQRRREHLVRRRLDAEVVANDRVSHLVVLPAADAVNEEIAETDAGKECEREGAGANAGIRSDVAFNALVARRELVVPDADGLTSVAGRALPERRFKPFPVGRQIRYRVAL